MIGLRPLANRYGLNQPFSTAGAFTRGGACFFSILFLGWLQLSELMKAVSGRAVAARQKDYAFYRPSAVALSRVITDFPVILIQVVLFGIIMYFMTNLRREPGAFFTFLLLSFTCTMAMRYVSRV